MMLLQYFCTHTHPDTPTRTQVHPYDTAAAAAYHAARPDPTMAIDRLHDIVYEQLDEVAKKEAAEAAPRRRCRGKQF